MNALEFRPDSSRFAPVRRLSTAGTHRGVHRDSVNEALLRNKEVTLMLLNLIIWYLLTYHICIKLGQ